MPVCFQSRLEMLLIQVGAKAQGALTVDASAFTRDLIYPAPQALGGNCDTVLQMRKLKLREAG